jgi:hypothetical protein
MRDDPLWDDLENAWAEWTGGHISDKRFADVASQYIVTNLHFRPTGIWQCKDYADGWITFPTRESAQNYHEETGALMRYLNYFPTSTGSK